MRRLLVIASLVFCFFCASVQAQVAVVNGASFRPEQPVCPGAWASAFGSFPGVTTANASAIPLPKELGGAVVTVDGKDAPLNYSSSTQINFLVPNATAAGVRPIQVKLGSTTITGSIRVMSTAPGLFMKEAPGEQSPLGAIQNQDFSENASQSPARRGQVIQIYATGAGRLQSTVEDGAAGPSDPLAKTVSTPQVFIGGVESEVQYSGLAPNFAGLWQINVVVPNGAFVTGRVPVRAFMDGVDSNEVSIFVAQ